MKQKIGNYAIDLMCISAKKHAKPITKTEELTVDFCDNAEYTPTEEYITTEEYDTILSAVKWSKANIEAKINVYYDSAAGFINMFKEMLEQQNPHNNIFIRDIRDIKFVQANEHLFSEKIPLGYRMSMLKLIVCLVSLTDDMNDAVVYADKNVGEKRKDQSRMNKEEIFNNETIKKLEKYGIVLNKQKYYSGLTKCTQFIEIVKNDEIIECLKMAINLCIYRGNEYIKHSEYFLKLPETMDTIPSSCTTKEIPIWYALKMIKQPIQISSKFSKDGVNIGINSKKDVLVDYNSDKHGPIPFGVIKGLLVDFSTEPPTKSISKDIIKYFLNKQTFEAKDVCRSVGVAHPDCSINGPIDANLANKVTYWDDCMYIGGEQVNFNAM